MNRPRGIQIAVATIVVTSIAGVLFASLLVRPKIEKDSAAGDADAVRDHVELSDEKFQAAEIKVAPAAKRELRRHRTLPGRLEYNATRHVELKAPFDGFIRRIDVKVGDRVTVGQVLAIVDSPELGDKRADVLLRETDLQQAKNEHDWWHEIQANLDELVARLKRPQEMPSGEKDEVSQFEKDFADKPLGDYRQQILAAYSRMRLDEKLSANAKAAAASGAVAGQRKLELDAARDTSRAKFAAACEQATFDVKQMHIKAESAMDDAGRRLEVARQRLGSLVGQSSETLPSVESKSALSTWPVKAPFTATIEEVLLPPNERLRMGQGLFQLADTSQLWVQADIRERDWSALSIEAGQTILMQTPALPGKTLEATVAFVGRSVTPESRAVPLIADVDNKSGLLRPGMFLRVLIPDKQTHECLTVPQSSIAENDGRAFVFVQTGPREFHPRDVKTGMSVDPWIEIVSGLNEGEQVVTEGTVLLKAELLLQAED